MAPTEPGSPAEKRSSKTQVIPQPHQPAQLPGSSRPSAQGAPVQGVQHTLRCVWTSHLHSDHRCGASIPAETVTEAWRIKKEASRMSEGFFRFSWGGGTWLGYGLPDGRVRGTYCPTHTAERDARAQGPTPEGVMGGAAGREVPARRARPLSLVK